jgi:NTP pyrophosphatase (non-canonical NTP hydrolase)
MDFEELEAFVEAENQRLFAAHEGLTAEMAPMTQTVKLNEEIGELCEAVLALDSLQREEKLAADGEHDVADEFADVIITAFLLADSIGIDPATALERKIEAVEARYE